MRSVEFSTVLSCSDIGNSSVAAMMAPDPDSQATNQMKRILIVEDEVLIALDTQETLKDAGFEVVGPADRIDRALALAESEPINGAILDVNLGKEQIWPVADALSARGIRFILLTGMASDCKVPDAHRNAPLVSKPILPERLLAALRTALKDAP